jgi:hypothetical protein
MKIDRVRTTISLPPEIHEIFKRMSEVSGVSISRCMGDWLADTGDAAEMITTQLEKARRSPMAALKEMRALVAGLGEAAAETHVSLGDLIDQVEAGTAGGLPAAASEDSPPAGHVATLPPSSNTGVLVPPVPIKSRGGKSGKSTSSRKKQ